MLFGKCERKKAPVGMILIVGALAACGAVTVAKKGKAIAKCAYDKIKGLTCRQSSEEC